MQTASDLDNADEAALHAATAVDWQGVGLYLLLTFGISWVFFFLKFADVPFLWRAGLGMFGPAIACVLVRLLRREGFADAGLRLRGRELVGTRGTWRFYILAYVLPLLLIAAGFLLGVLFQVQRWGLDEHYKEFVQILAAQTRTPIPNIPLVFAAQIVFAVTLGVVVTMIATFGEELGWRGYLLPRLAPLGAVRAAVIVGAIWGIWHAPIIIIDGYEFNGLYPALGVFFFMLFTIPTSVVFAWLRFRTGSIWPTVLAHAAINTLASLGLSTLFTWGNPYIAAPVGLLGVLPWLIYAGWLILTKRLQNSLAVSHSLSPT
ncbi:MAG: CPBP family intramembrane metalloprotease [Ktedonobacteraceae bacterium]